MQQESVHDKGAALSNTRTKPLPSSSSPPLPSRHRVLGCILLSELVWTIHTCTCDILLALPWLHQDSLLIFLLKISFYWCFFITQVWDFCLFGVFFVVVVDDDVHFVSALIHIFPQKAGLRASQVPQGLSFVFATTRWHCKTLYSEGCPILLQIPHPRPSK